VGELVYRLCTEALLRHSFRPDFLLPYQFGVGTKGGVEPVIRAAQRALDDSLGRSFTHLTSLDFSNRFNTVDRKEIASGLRRFALRSQPLPRRQMGLRHTLCPLF
jgi:hypothetical protein